MEFLQEEIKPYLLYLVKFLHISQSIILSIGPYITNNIQLLSLLIICYVLLITFWYLFDHCIWSPIEQYLEGNVIKYEDGSLKSFITVFFEKILGGEKNVYYIVTFIPVVNTIVALLKINYFILYPKMDTFNDSSNKSIAIDNNVLQIQIV